MTIRTLGKLAAGCLFIAVYLYSSAISGFAGIAAPVEKMSQKEVKRERERRIKELAKKKLNDTTWEIIVKPSGGVKKKGYPKTDTLVFENRKFISKNLETNGYLPTNYSIRVEPDGAIIMETMQSKNGKDVVFWRGERRGNRLRGVISKKDDAGKTDGYNFSSTSFERTKELEAEEGELEREIAALQASEEAGAAVVSTAKEKPKSEKTEPKEEKQKKWWWQR